MTAHAHAAVSAIEIEDERENAVIVIERVIEAEIATSPDIESEAAAREGNGSPSKIPIK